MLAFLKEEANKTRTENGAVTYRSTQSRCLDLFATIGALRGAGEAEITSRFLPNQPTRQTTVTKN